MPQIATQINIHLIQLPDFGFANKKLSLQYLVAKSGYFATSWSIVTLNNDGGANGSL